MKKKSFETIVYSVGGVAALLVILIAFNVITAACKERIDLTKEKAYTLTPGTKAILGKLDTPVKIRFYYSQNSGSGDQNLVTLKTYAQRVADLLAEYKEAAKGKIIVEKFDPEPDSDAEDSAHLDGVEGAPLSNGEKFYLGLAVHAADTTEAIPFFDPRRERLLEYDLSRAISRVANPEKPVIGVMSSLPVFGTQSNPMMMRMGQRGQEPWIFINELKSDYTVKQVEMTADKIDDDIKLLVVIHPKDISDKAQYAIDQFIMRGGKLVAFLDGLCMVDKTGQNLGQMQLPAGGSSLDKLLKAWGLQFDTTKVVADMKLKMQMGSRGQLTEAPAILSVTSDGLNKDDVATSEIDNLWLPYCGAFTGTPVSGLKETVLVKSTKDSQLVEGIMASMAGENIMKDFKPSDTEYALAVRLIGKFKTAFPDGAPTEKKEDDKSDKKTEKPAETLKETKTDNAVILFGDSDLLADEVTVRQVQTPFGVLSQPLNANLSLAQNMIEQLTGDNNLISVRSRATFNRPFTRIREMQARAEEAFQNKIKELQASLQETQQRVNELQRNKEKGQRFILSPEQQTELENFKKKEAQVKLELKQVRKRLTQEINSTENRLEWGNIIGMPLVVALSGIGIAIFKRKRTSAK